MSPQSSSRSRGEPRRPPGKPPGTAPEGKAPAKPKPKPPWRREAAGTYRSSDDRFTIEGDGAGRWFLRDSAEHDELGLERTIGPFATLDAAKEDAAGRRERGPERSPLEARLERAERSTTERGKEASPGGERRARAREGGRGQRDEAGQAVEHEERLSPEPKSVPRGAARTPRRPSWIDRLEARDPRSARLARRRVASLERLGVEDADALVRRDIEADEPAIAERLLELEVARAVEESLGGEALREAARTAGLRDEGDPSAAERGFARIVADRVAGAALSAIGVREHAAGADPDLPGWRLIEHDRELPDRRRRIRPGGPDAGGREALSAGGAGEGTGAARRLRHP